MLYEGHVGNQMLMKLCPHYNTAYARVSHPSAVLSKAIAIKHSDVIILLQRNFCQDIDRERNLWSLILVKGIFCYLNEYHLSHFKELTIKC